MLFTYLATLDETLAAVLIKERPSDQFPVYYISKALHALELNYSKIEKLMLVASCTLR